MIKVALLIPTLDQSGAEKQFTLLATGLPKDEFEVHAIALSRGGPYEEPLKQHGIPLTIIGKRFRFDPMSLWRLRQLIDGLRPDILHSWLFAANASARLIAGRGLGPKVLVSERCVDTWKSPWQHWVDRVQRRRATRLIGNSQSVADYYQSQGFPAERIVVIPNGVEVNTPPPAIRNKLLAELNLPKNARLVGYVGRLARQKRIDDLIWSIELVRHMHRNSYLLIVGDGPERERLMQFARDVRCRDQIRFLGSRSDVMHLLPLLDVFWLASDFEGLSNSLMEAMASGVPVVASDIPPNRELVVDQSTGYLVSVGDRAAFADKTLGLLRDSERAKRMGEAGRDRIREEFGVQKMVDAYADLYRTVAKASLPTA